MQMMTSLTPTMSNFVSTISVSLSLNVVNVSNRSSYTLRQQGTVRPQTS